MEHKGFDNIKLIVELDGERIFEGGWCDARLPSDERQIGAIQSIVNKYREHLLGFINGIKHNKGVSKKEL